MERSPTHDHLECCQLRRRVSVEQSLQVPKLDRSLCRWDLFRTMPRRVCRQDLQRPFLCHLLSPFESQLTGFPTQPGCHFAPLAGLWRYGDHVTNFVHNMLTTQFVYIVLILFPTMATMITKPLILCVHLPPRLCVLWWAGNDLRSSLHITRWDLLVCRINEWYR